MNNYFKKIDFILGNDGKQKFIFYNFIRTLAGLFDSFYIFIISIVYSFLKPENNLNIEKFSFIKPEYIIFLVLIYIFFYIQFQRYIYKLDSELAYKTKERIIKKFDNLDQPDKLNFDKGLITTNLGQSFELFHVNVISGIGQFSQNLGNLLVLSIGSIFLIGTKIILIIILFGIIIALSLFILKPRQLKIGEMIKKGQVSSTTATLYYLRLLEKLNFLKDVKNSILKDIVNADISIRKGIASLTLTQIYTKTSLDGLILILMLTLIFILKINNSDFIVVILIGIRCLPVIQTFINSIGKLNSSKEIINSLYSLISQFKETNSKTNIFISNKNNILKISPINKLKNNWFKLTFFESDNKLISHEKENNTLFIDTSPGKRYSIIGKSGAGKSTLMKSIAGQNNYYSKKLFIKKNNKLSNLENITESMIYIPQEPELLSGTALYNITCENDINKINKKRLIDSINTSEFIDNVTNKNIFDTLRSINIDKDGKGLSGGERQRLIIAQAIYFNPYFLLVDEGLCSLSNKVAQRISEKIFMSKIPCILYISHNDVDLKLWSNTITILS